VTGIGYFIFKIDSRVKREGSLFKREDTVVKDVNLPGEVEGKKFWIRVLAYILDFIVIYGFNTVAGYSFGFVFFAGLSFILVAFGKDFYFAGSENIVLNWTLGIVLNIVYFTTFEWIHNGSLGKLILGMRVVNLNGQKCNLRQASIRAVYRLLDGLVLGMVPHLPGNGQRLLIDV
jgi:uncharacterized RDD family membrane protein YckC